MSKDTAAFLSLLAGLMLGIALGWFLAKFIEAGKPRPNMLPPTMRAIPVD